MSAFLVTCRVPLARSKTSLHAQSALKISPTSSLALPIVYKAAREDTTRRFKKRLAQSASHPAVTVRAVQSSAHGATQIANSPYSSTISVSNRAQKAILPSMANVKGAKALAKTA